MNKAAGSRDFLFAIWEGGGNVPPVLSAVRRLVARRHRVRIMSDRCNRDEIEAAGAEFIGYSLAPNRSGKTAAWDLLRDWEGATPEDQITRLLDRVMCGPALEYARDVLAEGAPPA